MTKMSSQAVGIGFASALAAFMMTGCGLFDESYEEVALCENITHQRVDENYCQNSHSDAVSWVFISSSSDYRVGSYGQYIDTNRVTRVPTSEYVSYGGLRGVSNTQIKAVPKSTISGKSYTSPGIARGGLGSTGGGKGGGS